MQIALLYLNRRYNLADRLSKEKLNWYIPNAEFCTASTHDLRKFDLILCKTEEALKIFQPLHPHVYYLGFTSIDHYLPSISKDFTQSLHLAGKSQMKGTETVFKVWRNHPELLALTLIKHLKRMDPKSLLTKKFPYKNIKFITQRVPSQTLLSIQNECGIHICPSKTEGFGHYIMEAMSTGAVVVTTDAPPMNEFITDKRCLVKYKKTEKMKYATVYLVDDQDLFRTVKSLQQLSQEELMDIGQHNREEFLRRKREFRENFINLINQATHELLL
jgi:glycosyltransferase involved in cell wall biosynthesis